MNTIKRKKYLADTEYSIAGKIKDCNDFTTTGKIHITYANKKTKLMIDHGTMNFKAYGQDVESLRT